MQQTGTVALKCQAKPSHQREAWAVTFSLEYFVEKLVADCAAKGRGLSTEQEEEEEEQEEEEEEEQKLEPKYSILWLMSPFGCLSNRSDLFSLNLLI